MRINHFIRLCLAAAFVAAMASLSAAQCETCDAGCGGGPCEGRCQYCVDGECTPNRTTYGYYQTQWRRWPVPAPAVPERSMNRRQRPAVTPGEVDLPAPEDETEFQPEFPRLRKRGGSNATPSSDSRPYEFEPAAGANSMENPRLESMVPEEMAPANDAGAPMPNVDLPEADMEDSLFDGAVRMRQGAIRQVSGTIPKVAVDNPLRSRAEQLLQLATAKESIPKATPPKRLKAYVRGQSTSPLRSPGTPQADPNPLR